MRIEYSERAIDDLNMIALDSLAFGEGVAEAIGLRLSEAVAQIAWDPRSGGEVRERPGVYVVPLVRYPFIIFYRILKDRVRILHVRHTSRRSWEGQ
jgi:plasmid stabilization system protein ParE